MTERPPRSFCLPAPAIITGFAAAEIPRLLRRYAREPLEEYPFAVRELLEDALRAMDEAAAQWRATSARGTAEVLPAEVLPHSDGEPDEIGTREAANMLRVSERWTRQLATDGHLPGHKRQGRWSFIPAAVLAYDEGRQR
jgi:hypothetical protein